MSGDRRLHVLIADDDASIRRMLTVLLQKEGYRTSDACDGVETLEAMRMRQVDLVLLDLMMPKVTGWDVLAERAAAADLGAIPVIIITAARGRDVAKIPLDATCAMLPKPFELDALRTMVKTCLEQRLLSEENKDSQA
jgi:DNA-binding response OmpR family regulator